MSRESFGVRPRNLDEACAIIDQLLTTIANQQATITALETRLAAQRADLAALRGEVAALTERLGQSSRNSSRPPSSDPPQTPPPRRPRPSGRRPGAQPGHDAHTRALLPTAAVDAVVVLKPPRCRRCRTRLHGSDPHPRRHQVTELPPIRPTITEYQRHTLTCAQCGVATAAPWPAGVPRGVLGPRLVALVAVCTGVYHLSKRTTAGLLADLFRVPVAVGTITACEQAVSASVAAPVAAAQAYVQQQAAVVHADETGWREGRQRAWLWVAVTSLVTVFLVHRRRGAVAARQLLGASAAILVSDRWSAYAWWPLTRRQLCWAHLVREFVAFTERGGAAAALGRALLRDTQRMFTDWHRVRDGTWTRVRFQTAMQPRRARVERRLRAGAQCGHAPTAATCRELLALAPALWTFVDVPGVEPTNNAAERALRPAVLWRKGCWGTHSAEGSRFVERILTVATTLKQQHRNIVDYVTQACVAALHGQEAPSLLPDSVAASAAA